jgi:RNA polymerase-binding transcription factor DksA
MSLGEAETGGDQGGMMDDCARRRPTANAAPPHVATEHSMNAGLPRLPRTAAWLRARQYELADRLERLNRDVQRTHDPLVQDFSDQAVQRYRLHAITECELDRIDAALARIAAGSYGRCERCGERIDPACLEVLPQSVMCKSCKSARTDAGSADAKRTTSSSTIRRVHQRA